MYCFDCLKYVIPGMKKLKEESLHGDFVDTHIDILKKEMETMEIVKSDIDEMKQLRRRYECKICFVRNINTFFNSCGHAICCDECAKKISNCPICATESEYSYLYIS